MKKILTLLFVLCAMTAKAQVFVGGTSAIGYANENFHLGLIPEIGYEFSEKWAAGAGLGFTLVAGDGNTTAVGNVEPFVRYTPWQSDRLAFDIKAVGDMEFHDGLCASDLGLRPSFRFFLNKNWDFNADFGLFGARYNGNEWKPAFIFTGTSVKLGVAYKF